MKIFAFLLFIVLAAVVSENYISDTYQYIFGYVSGAIGTTIISL